MASGDEYAINKDDPLVITKQVNSAECQEDVDEAKQASHNKPGRSRIPVLLNSPRANSEDRLDQSDPVRKHRLRQVEVRYLNLGNFKDKIKPDCNGCNEFRCPRMIERRHVHQQEHHVPSKTDKGSSPNRNTTRGYYPNKASELRTSFRSDKSSSPIRGGRPSFSSKPTAKTCPDADECDSCRFNTPTPKTINPQNTTPSSNRSSIGFGTPNRCSTPIRALNDEIRKDKDTCCKNKTDGCCSSPETMESLPQTATSPVATRCPSFYPPLTTSDAQTSRFDVDECDLCCKSSQPTNKSRNRDIDFHTRPSDIPLKNTETRDVLTPKQNFYNEELEDVVQNWSKDLPIYPSFSSAAKSLKENVISNLIQKINQLSNEINNTDYERKVKDEIDKGLRSLTMWSPGARRDQISFREELAENLLNSIRNLNLKWLQAPKSLNNNYSTNCTENNTNTEVPEKYEAEIINWLANIGLITINENQLAGEKKKNTFLNRLIPIVNDTINTRNHKLKLKGEIVNLLHDLPLCISCQSKRNLYINKLADDLANKLLSIRALDDGNRKSSCCVNALTKNILAPVIIEEDIDTKRHKVVKNDLIKEVISKEVSECLINHEIDINYLLTDEIADTVIKAIHLGDDSGLESDICTIIQRCTHINESKALNIAESIVTNIINAVIRDFPQCNNVVNRLINQLMSETLLVYTSEHSISESFNDLNSSTPKYQEVELYKMNSEEKVYMNDLKNVINNWMENLPKQFNASIEKGFKETVIEDLAISVLDQVKFQQLVPNANVDQNDYLKLIIMKWLFKIGVYDENEVTLAIPQIEDLIRRLQRIAVPILTRPRHGNRQDMERVKFYDGPEYELYKSFQPEHLMLLEDNISVWMNEQPLNAYVNNDSGYRTKMLHELAEKLHKRIESKDSDSEIVKEIVQWLRRIMKMNESNRIDEMAKNLLCKILKIPSDSMFERIHNEKIEALIKRIGVNNEVNEQQNLSHHTYAPAKDVFGEDDEKIKVFLQKFIEHNYSVDDSVARGALTHVLITELRKLSPNTRKEVCDNFSKSKPHDAFIPERFDRELRYIKDISDWLKSVKVEPSFNRPGNRDRIEVVINLAKTICEIEDEHNLSPNKMDYAHYVTTAILDIVSALIPLAREYRSIDYLRTIITQLCGKLAATSKIIPFLTSNEKRTIRFKEDDKIHEQDISDFINEYVYKNGRDIGDDELKAQVWYTRLIQELIKLVNQVDDVTVLSKLPVYNKLADIPVPRDESVRIFNLNLCYIQEISDWLRNLPLQQIKNQSDNDDRIRKIYDLAHQMTERTKRKSNNPNDAQADADLVEFIKKWVKELPLNQEIVLPIVISQIMNRMEKVNENNIKSKNIPKTEAYVHQKTSGSRSPSIQIKRSFSFFNDRSDPANDLVEALEKWCKELPLKGPDEAMAHIKDNILRALLVKIGELNFDPQIFNNKLLYRDMLAEEIELQLQNASQFLNLSDPQKGNLRNKLLSNILERIIIIKELSAGKKYLQKLENAVENSFPNPVNIPETTDGFKIYKNRLASIFILDNFDHADDNIKLLYEKRIKKEIEKYFNDAQKRNAVPLSEERLYNELYSALFKVPVPNEASVADEVEEFKTRIEVDIWFEELPIREGLGIIELLECDDILATLAKRLHVMEKKESSPDAQMLKETLRCLAKLPLITGIEKNYDQISHKLISRLKTTREKRKYVPQNVKGKSKLVQPKRHFNNLLKGCLEESQVVGPNAYSRTWTTPPCCQPVPQKKPADLIIEVVEAWCNSLPIDRDTVFQQSDNIGMLIDNLATNIIRKICELNADTEVFQNDFMYDSMLDAELDQVLSTVPLNAEFEQIKDSKKLQLIKAINSVKPLIKDDQARHNYKESLKHTVMDIVNESLNVSDVNQILYSNLLDEIVDDYVEYRYNKDDDEAKSLYKSKIHNALEKFIMNLKQNREKNINPQMIRNQLVCEMNKVPIPGPAAFQEEVYEIRMKHEISELFNQVQKKDEGKTNCIKESLAKRLNDLEKSGHNSINEEKMKNEIVRSFKKLGTDVSPKRVEEFVDQLRLNESIRKAWPIDPQNQFPEGYYEQKSIPYPNDAGSRRHWQTINNSVAQQLVQPAIQKQSIYRAPAHVNHVSGLVGSGTGKSQVSSLNTAPSPGRGLLAPPEIRLIPTATNSTPGQNSRPFSCVTSGLGSQGTTGIPVNTVPSGGQEQNLPGFNGNIQEPQQLEEKERRRKRRPSRDEFLNWCNCYKKLKKRTRNRYVPVYDDYYPFCYFMPHPFTGLFYY